MTHPVIKRLAAFALALASLPVLPAHAQPDQCGAPAEARFVIKYSHLDLSRAGDRKALVTQLDRTTRDLCECRSTKTLRAACAADAEARTLKSLPQGVRAALETARLEQRTQMQAQASRD